MSVGYAIFWVSAALLVYTYLGYPALLWLWSVLQPHAVRTGNVPRPSVTLVVVAYNEAQRIRQRLENFLDLDYAWDRLDIIVASDGSTDGTADVARAYRSPFIRVIEFRTRRGKSAVLDDVIPLAKGDIVVLTDTRQRLESNALHALVDRFSDPDVGAVGGELVLLNSTKQSEIGEGVDFYWKYEKFMRRHESDVDSSIGVTGALYALRKSLFRRIPVNTILDDVLIPMEIARQGYRVLFEPRARAYDWVTATGRDEFTRKLRTIAGNFQLFFGRRWLLNPAENRLWFQTVSHKVCRLLSPLWLITAFAGNFMLVADAPYRWLLGLQLIFYMAALLGHLARRARHRPIVLSVPYAFCILNLATIMALIDLLNGNQQVTWEKHAG